MRTEPKLTAENILCTLICYTVGSDYMRTLQSSPDAFQKVGECLYRYSNGVYYGRIRVDGKEIKRSLRTTDKALARRRLSEFRDEQRQTDRSQGRITLAELCKRYLLTVQRQKPKKVPSRLEHPVLHGVIPH